MSDLVGNPEDRFSRVEAQFMSRYFYGHYMHDSRRAFVQCKMNVHLVAVIFLWEASPENTGYPNITLTVEHRCKVAIYMYMYY